MRGAKRGTCKKKTLILKEELLDIFGKKSTFANQIKNFSTNQQFKWLPFSQFLTRIGVYCSVKIFLMFKLVIKQSTSQILSTFLLILNDNTRSDEVDIL